MGILVLIQFSHFSAIYQYNRSHILEIQGGVKGWRGLKYNTEPLPLLFQTHGRAFWPVFYVSSSLSLLGCRSSVYEPWAPEYLQCRRYRRWFLRNDPSLSPKHNIYFLQCFKHKKLHEFFFYQFNNNSNSLCDFDNYPINSKTCLRRPLKKTKKWFSRPIITYCKSKELQNAQREHSAILLTFIKLQFVF